MTINSTLLRNAMPSATVTSGAPGANLNKASTCNHTGCIHISPCDRLLSCLDGVRQTGPGRWLAKCPGPIHRRGDRNASLSIGETVDGAALIHCFAGCEPTAILAALDLELSDLFPPRDPAFTYSRPKAPPIPWRDMFSALETDLITCSLAFNALAAGKPFSATDAAYIAQRADDLAAIVREVRHGR